MAYRLRFRSLLSLIAVSAVVMAGSVVGTRKMRELRAEYRARSAHHAELAQHDWVSSRVFQYEAREHRRWPDAGFRAMHRIDEQSKEYAERKALYIAEAEMCDAQRLAYSVRAAYHDRMKVKYSRAVERPWWPVSEDPAIPALPDLKSVLPTFPPEVRLSR